MVYEGYAVIFNEKDLQNDIILNNSILWFNKPIYVLHKYKEFFSYKYKI